MRYLSLILAAAAALAFGFAGTATAQPAWPAWYIGLHGSLDFVGKEKADTTLGNAKIDNDTGFGVGGALGYRLPFGMGPWNAFRVEAEYHHEEADHNNISYAGNTFNLDGKSKVDAAMANLYYDFATGLGSLKPYIGGGVGYANVDAGQADDDVFAYQGMVGLGYAPETLPFTEFTLGYRYFGTSDPKFNVSGLNVKSSYDSHNIELGAKFNF